MKIPPTIEPIAHISPYRRIDTSHPGRKRVITLDEWQASRSTREPDPAIYSYDAGALLPRFLSGAIGLDRMRQENAGAE